MASTPKAFLFDIGNVLIEFDLSLINPAVQASSPIANLDFLAVIDEAKIALEDGAMDDESFVTECIKAAQFQGDRASFTKIWQEIFAPNTPMIETVRALSARGFPLYILSNTSGLHMDYILRTWDVFACFDGAVYSYDVKLSKPDPAIYTHAAEKFGLDPAETVYIDDRPENAEAGRAAGFLTFQYDLEDHAAFLRFLEDSGIRL